jgi:hypothetical protein
MSFQVSHNASPKDIFAVLQEIPNLACDDLLRAYCILTSNDRKFFFMEQEGKSPTDFFWILLKQRNRVNMYNETKN